MAEAGILHEDDRVELIDGEIVEMAAIGSAHAACVDRVNALLVGLSGSDFVIRVQNPLALGEHLEPQPDFFVVRGGDYRNAHPGTGDALLVIEVSDTSLTYDREVKLPLYASGGSRGLDRRPRRRGDRPPQRAGQRRLSAHRVRAAWGGTRLRRGARPLIGRRGGTRLTDPSEPARPQRLVVNDQLLEALSALPAESVAPVVTVAV